VELRYEAAASLPAIDGEPSSIHQIALNLITNAWQALGGHTGQIEIRLASCRVDSVLQQQHPELRSGPHVRLSISDTGSGIDAETQRRIFEPFFTTKPSGTGLGLSVVHGIVRSYGGAIVVDSELGVGSTFHVYLPASTTAAAVEHVEPSQLEAARGHAERILFIDDEPSLARLGATRLKRLGYQVEAYAEPTKAIAAFRNDPDRFDLVITDYNMPQMSGLDVAQQLLEIRPSATVALVTGFLREEDVEHARAIGIREILLKPISIDELGPVLRRMLDGRARH
jgi:CheY-like chemotaxis protein